MSRTRIAVVLAAVGATLFAAAPALAVTAGMPASRDYPHMAALFDDGRWICGSSLIAPDWILTAAHCVDGAQRKPGKISFQIGGKQLGHPDNERRTATQIVVHAKWDDSTLRYDVALAKLDRPSDKTPVALAGPLQAELWDGGSPARVIGYGMPTHVTRLLFQTDVPMVPDGDPSTTAGSVDPRTCAGGNLLTAKDLETMVCAGEPYGVKDACFGDSGGPLMVPAAGDFGATLLQVGVVSWGYACGVPTKYGVYSRVADNLLYDWVQKRGAGEAAPVKAPNGNKRSSRGASGNNSGARRGKKTRRR